MSIRWSVILLLVLGLAAAAAAAVFTASLSAQQLNAFAELRSPDIEILVAKHELPALATVKQEDVEVRTVSQDGAPKGYLTEETQVVGRILNVPVVTGQAFTDATFPVRGSGVHLASMLPPGKRAVNVALSDYEGLVGLIYPGSVVDVLATFRIDTGANRIGKAVSTTLLQNVEVLAVENLTVGSSEDDSEVDTDVRPASLRKQPLVTLLVDSKQAEALQLAMKWGSVTLAMRNPGDKEKIDQDATLLSEGRLAALAEALNPQVGPAGQRITRNEAVQVVAAPQPPRPQTAQPQTVTVEAKAPARSAPRGPSMYDLTVIRGLESEAKRFPDNQ